ncbi:hypothetical protein [Dermatobacter hominis]|uniref:hypothetical protein n=1 Tax=Dermatobacter hominis TaxID=2884263 RepID=UPI001D10E2B5|nr:hypothetical protein [Dermatobacter hominis]UDY34111.1 hypothetical protein LH044_12235 [Dermatobacter hominis]
MPVSPSRSTLIAAVLAAAVVTSAVVALGSAPAQAQQRHAVVVADSILLGAQGPLVGQLQGAGWSVDFDGAVSRSTLAGAEAVRSHAGGLTDTLVISLGANDGGNAGTFRQRVDAVMAAAAGVPHVYWITIREVRPYYGPANQVLRDAATRYPNLTIVDWHAASAGRSDLTSSDGLHLTSAGGRALAGLLAGAITSGAPAPVAVATTAPPPPTTAAPPATTVPAPATTVPAPAPTAPPTGTPTAATVPLDRSLFVTGALPGRVTRAAAVPAPAGGGVPWGWLLVVALLVGGTAIVFQRLGFRTASGPVRHASVTRAQLRAARIAGARGRHPAAAPTPPMPEEPSPDVGPSELSGTVADRS